MKAMNETLIARLKQILKADPGELTPLAGGCVGEVYGLEVGGKKYVVKVDRRGAGVLEIEGRMLEFLAGNSELPIPLPIAYDNTFILMPRLPGATSEAGSAELHAAELFAQLHNTRGEQYGFDYDTVIGGLPQPNGYSDSWIDFFAEKRLLAMATQAHDAGKLPIELMRSLERLAAKLPDLIDEPVYPSLIHGDVWGGNVLAENGRVTGLLDPAIYYADAEIELAFITLFSTFGDTFFGRYRELRTISDDFMRTKRPLYNLYPLLVHTRLFAGSYVTSVAATLKQFV